MNLKTTDRSYKREITIVIAAVLLLLLGVGIWGFLTNQGPAGANRAFGVGEATPRSSTSVKANPIPLPVTGTTRGTDGGSNSQPATPASVKTDPGTNGGGSTGGGGTDSGGGTNGGGAHGGGTNGGGGNDSGCSHTGSDISIHSDDDRYSRV